MSWGSTIRTCNRRASKARRLPVTPFPIGAPNRVLPPASRSYRDRERAGLLVPGASCARRDLNPHNPPAHGSSTLRLCLWATKTWSPPPASGLLPYRGAGAASRCAARRSLPGLESDQRAPVSETGRDANNPPGIECGRRESNAQAASFEEARSAGCRHSRRVRRGNFEIPTIGLRARCSASELTGAWSG